MSLASLLRLIQQNDPVKSNVVNAPLQQLDQNVRYIYQLLQAASFGSTVYATEQTVESTAAVGMPVYYNTSTARFERGLAATSTDTSLGIVTTAASARIWGIVGSKANATLADILLFGYAAIDISAAVTGSVVAGDYYLSGATAGMLIKQKLPVSVAVLRATGDGHVYVMPQYIDFLDRHNHYRFSLTCYPAGDTTPPEPGQHHVISNADADLPGWLPADHESFNDKAPAGAVFGYNIAKQSALAAAWPPLPVSNAYLEWNKGNNVDVGGTGVPLGTDGLAIIDRNGIWWMSRYYGEVPWPVDTDTSSSESTSVSDSQEARALNMLLDLYYTRVNFATSLSSVLSLTSTDARLVIKALGTDTASSVGDLAIALDLDFVATTAANGYQVLKTFDPDTNTFAGGPAVEGVYALSSQVIVSGSTSRKLVLGDEDSATVWQGLVGITYSPPESLELDVSYISGATQSVYQNILYISFPAAETQTYRAKMYVPAGLSIESPQLALRFVLLGRTLGTLPQLTITARRVPRSLTAAALPLSADEFDVTCVTVSVLTDNNQYIEVTSDPFEVAAGDTVYFSVTRSNTDLYAGEVGVIQQTGVITSSA